MKRLHGIAIWFGLALTVSLIPMTIAMAQTMAPVRPGINSFGQADADALRSGIQRQQFQQQQQIYRELDRQVTTPSQNAAPAIRQPCQQSLNGGGAVGGCR